MQIQQFIKGRYAGTNTAEMSVEGILLSQTIYKKDTISDWHFHEHPYFALILNGGSTEVRKTTKLECLPGHAYFYNWEDVHRNKDYQEGSRNFNIEFDKSWLRGFNLDVQMIRGITLLTNPDQQLLLTKLYKEYTLVNGSSSLSIQALAFELISLIGSPKLPVKSPPWVLQIKEILNDRWSENISLQELSNVLGIHPVNISRYFPKYVGCTFGEYIRKIRIARSLPLLRSSPLSLTDISYECGFADQSHYCRTFKQLTNFSPRKFRSS